MSVEVPQSIDKMVEDAGPVEDCESCQSFSTLKIGGLCILHAAAARHPKGELRSARNDLEDQKDVSEYVSNSRKRFKKRAKGAFPDRWVSTRCIGKGIYDGENIAWLTSRDADVFHADKNCPHFPTGKLVALPMSHARSKYWTGPCSHCTTEASHD